MILAAVRARLAALDLGEPLLEAVEARVVLLAVLVVGELELVERVVDRGHEAVRLADIRAQRVDIGAEVGAVALEDLRRFLEHGLQLLCATPHDDCTQRALHDVRGIGDERPATRTLPAANRSRSEGGLVPLIHYEARRQVS